MLAGAGVELTDVELIGADALTGRRALLRARSGAAWDEDIPRMILSLWV